MEDNEENETKEIRKVRNKGMADVTKLSRKQRNFLLFWEGNKRNDDPSYVPLSIPSLAKKYKFTYLNSKQYLQELIEQLSNERLITYSPSDEMISFI